MKYFARILTLAFLALPAAGQTRNFSEYWPIACGHSWKFTNSADASDTYLYDALGTATLGGSPVWRVGPDQAHCFLFQNDGSAFTIAGYVDDGTEVDITDVTIGDFVDGDGPYDVEPGIFVVLRMWDELDHSLTGAYGLDPGERDVVLWVWYHDTFDSNDQNTVLESGGGVQYDAGVTDVDFYKKGVGPIAQLGVDAEDGDLEAWYDAVADLDWDGGGPPTECVIIGSSFCTPVANSTGIPGRMTVWGSDVVGDDDLALWGGVLPPQPNIGYFIMGTGTNTFTPPGSTGPICVAPGIKRFLPPVNNTTQLGAGFARSVGTSGPDSGNITVGSTWSFQAWHRDQAAGTSNLTDAVTVAFQ